ncbi:MAG: GNAT family N-acetyltransferase [Chitinophagaceae bacterium]|nr:GNAT family N-acetyltransferase [Chitinophagaceae bacterium]
MIKDIFKENPVLENERVLLRPIKEEDVEHLLPFSLNEPDIWKFGLITAAGEENLRNYINGAVKNMQEKKEYVFIVFDKKTNRYAGSTRFYDIQPQYGYAQLGFTWYGKEFQRSGLNRHCKLLLLTYVFEEWGMERLEFRAHAKNEKSIEAMKAIGCVAEGILRSQMPTVDGSRRDSIVLSILKNEWFGGVKKLLETRTR